MTTVFGVNMPCSLVCSDSGVDENELLCDNGWPFCLPPDLAIQEEYLTLKMGSVNPSKTSVTIF